MPVQKRAAVSRLRWQAPQAHLSEVVAMGSNLRVAPADLADSIQIRLQRMYPGSRYVSATGALSVPMPRPNGEPLDDNALIEWTKSLLTAIFPPAVLSAT